MYKSNLNLLKKEIMYDSLKRNDIEASKLLFFLILREKAVRLAHGKQLLKFTLMFLTIG